MNPKIRPGTREDAAACGLIDFEAFKSISSEHNFPWDFPSVEIATTVVTMMLSNPGFYSVVAEIDGRVVGSNFLDERNPISGVGPISVDPALQNQTIGRQLMQAVMERSAQRGFAGIRLVQSAYHNRSLCLYTKLGFDTRETLSKMFGPPPRLKLPGYEVRRAAERDLETCNQLCRRVHGHDRGGELRDAINQGTANVVEHLGRITGYATEFAFFGHAVGETNQDIEALISAAPEIGGGGFLLPTRNSELFRWCLQNGLRLVHQMTLMTIGLYNEPTGSYLPSVLY
ncbi:MAG TPA: GNAT family N-acetyltransferase [Candidatus Binatus sp.]|uniref:GNAT family N-acetyltransferase n=1 Tax=Candidatus Binatus sp. TaxID=2811406 RepID=UPI002B49A32F|nr:GNAT family N-acetyltransferase [Candidatus Binatus sp.]HKN13515.1 GNAT family N-acetyltransferase [Candidatus Binatus sp.]